MGPVLDLDHQIGMLGVAAPAVEIHFPPSLLTEMKGMFADLFERSQATRLIGGMGNFGNRSLLPTGLSQAIANLLFGGDASIVGDLSLEALQALLKFIFGLPEIHLLDLSLIDFAKDNLEDGIDLDIRTCRDRGR